MSANILAKVTMPQSTGIPHDDVVNDFAFAWSGAGTPTTTDLTNLTACLYNFYNITPTGGTNPVGYYMSGMVSRATLGCTVKYYDMHDPIAEPFGSPLLVDHFTFGLAGTAAGDDYPNEVSIVLSLSAVIAPGTTHLGRSRGRIFIGPLHRRCSDLTSLTPRPSSTCRTDFGLAAHQLASQAVGADFAWSIWSRADHVLKVIAGGWVDDAFDTQRRRGIDATTRTAWSI